MNPTVETQRLRLAIGLTLLAGLAIGVRIIYARPAAHATADVPTITLERYLRLAPRTRPTPPPAAHGPGAARSPATPDPEAAPPAATHSHGSTHAHAP
ncbi:MAG: hypothetical protein K0V04_16555 [Deltaproteobacteria bacterium]|nr:hypothetical protein [Deltaproteobacteria bacterium]